MLRGPSSVLYGDTSTAGLLNLISKRPQAKESHEIGVQYGSFDRKQLQFDSTGKLTKDGEWLYRFIGVLRDSDMQTDYVKDNRIVLAPSVTWRPTNNTSWTVLGTYQKDKTGSSTAFLPHEGTLFAGPNGLIPVRRFSSEPGFDRYQTETAAISSLFEHSINNAVTIRQNTRYAHVEGIYRTMYPDVYIESGESIPRSRATHRGALYLSRETSKDSLTSDTQRRTEVRHRSGRAQDAVRRRLSPPSGKRVVRRRLRSQAVRSLCAGLYWHRCADAVAGSRMYGKASSGFMRRTRCGLARGSLSSACARITSPTMSRDRPRKTPGRPPAARR